ncbi:hypothetical protein QSJ18_17005 [Gordonia sp. ABSL1-1]|uniref:hypothetical protein n=1 Tax=Gordonia sp. ABSL1-1 TaxID=3053923 RepID=UPI002573518F|nr:hypothetical protein [Gordonia sp. ABSL1-1]MDL9938450.1 hypothetical protein [Gordonia sp. ABSL1-1]
MDLVVAHGTGGAADLPVPFTYALIGGAWALTLSFVITIVIWKTPRLDPERVGHALPRRLAALSDDKRMRSLLRALTLVVLGWVAIAAVAGSSETAQNPLPGVLYVLVWVGLVPATLLLGPFWRVLSPWRTLHRFVFRDRPAPLTLPARVGVWPGAIGLFAFAWLELAASSGDQVWAVKAWLIGYVSVVVVGSILFGRSWCAAADPFEVYSSLVAHLAIVGRGPDGRLAWRNPLDALGGLVPVPGIVTVVAVLLGSTAFDSFNAFPGWTEFVDDSGHEQLWRTIGLGCAVAIVASTYLVATQLVGGMSRTQRRALPGLLVHSIVPIVVGYIFAHYLSYLVENGQTTLILLADPADAGWNPLGISDLSASFVLSEHQGLLATLKVMFVLTGHVIGVIAAHDRALRVLPKGHQLSGQLGLIVVMVAYTFGGLYLLFGG